MSHGICNGGVPVSLIIGIYRLCTTGSGLLYHIANCIINIGFFRTIRIHLFRHAVQLVIFHGDSETTPVGCGDVIAIGIIGKAFKGSIRIHGFCHVAKIIIAVGCSSAFGIHTCGLVAVIVILILCHISGIVDAFCDVTCRIIAVMAGEGNGFAIFFPCDCDTCYFAVFVIGI